MTDSNHHPTNLDAALALGARIQREVLEPLKQTFVAKDEVIDLLGVSLVAGENLFIMGPPGTAKSALVQELGRRLDGKTFEYLLTRFTEPNELFGPFDIRKLREGDLITNTEGMLPEASLAFLDELLNANSSILNSLLSVLNERMFRRGRETRKLPLLMVVGASNHLPEDDALRALFDRFLLRVHCDYVPPELLSQVLDAGWKLDIASRASTHGVASTLTLDEVRTLSSMISRVDLAPVRQAMIDTVRRLRLAGIPLSDRRAVKLQRPIAASALLSGRLTAQISDLWVFRYIWETLEQQEVLSAVVKDVLDRSPNEKDVHPRARDQGRPDPESLARDLEALRIELTASGVSDAQKSALRDRLALLSARCEWVADAGQRSFLQDRVKVLFTAGSGSGGGGGGVVTNTAIGGVK